MRYKLNKKEIEIVIEKLKILFENPRTELNYNSDTNLLVATILSAQCTDVRVNKTTEELFKICKSPRDYVNLGEEKLKEYIKPCGFFNTKAKNIIATCKILDEKFSGKVPSDFNDLIKLPGVGRKTANVVVSNLFGTPAIAVDTHVFRASNRIGITNEKDVLNTELSLMKRLPEKEWISMHHRLILLGRRICKASNPKCSLCPLKDICLYFKRSSINEEK